MSKILKKVHSALKKTLQDNFADPIKLIGDIQSININEKYIIIKTKNISEYNKIIECHTTESISNLKIGDLIFMEGWFKTDNENIVKIYLQIKYFYLLSEKEIYQQFLKNYNRLNKALTEEYNFQCAIKRLGPKQFPKMINNIALIVMPENEKHIEDFKISFQEKCIGKLYVYRLKDKEGSIEEALKFFKKYHYIDLICLLTDQISIKDVKLLSSKECIKYMLNRKEHPYIISIANQETHETFGTRTSLYPLSALLSNKVLNSINKCTDLIHKIQFSFKKQIETKLEFGKQKLLEKIDKEKIKMTNLESELSNVLGMSLNMTEYDNNNNGNDNNKFGQIKNLLIRKLDDEMKNLLMMKNSIMENIIEDDRLQYCHQLVFQSEKNTLDGRIMTKKDFEKMSKNVFDNTSTLVEESYDNFLFEHPKKIENIKLNINNNNSDDIYNIPQQNGEF